MPKLTPTIIQEAPHHLVLHKPAGLVSDQQWDYPSVEGWVNDYLSEQGAKKPYVGMVHRLDRLTSGLLLVAKRKSSLRILQQQFEQRRVQKNYLALVESVPDQPGAILENYLEKDQAGKRAIIHQQSKTGTKLARLAYKTVWEKEGKALLEVELMTGRFHQIRAQLSSIGCPVVGDAKYGASSDFGEFAIALQAHRLLFFDPQTEEKVIVEGQWPSWG